MNNEKKQAGNPITDAVKRVFKHEAVPIFLVLVAIGIVVSSVNKNFTSWMNVRNILTQVSVTGMLTLGMFLLMLSGNTDLSVAWLVTFLCCGATVLITEHGWPVIVALPLLLLTSVACETFMGFIIATTKISAFIVSLGFQAMYMSFTFLITNGSERSLSNHLSWLNQFPLGLSTLVYIFIGVVILFYLILKFTKFSRRLYAVGCNNDAAYLSGINVTWFKISLFSINGVMVGLAAIMQMARLNSASPNMATGLEINAIAACVVGGTAMSGGKGNILGVLVGIVLLGITKNAMTMLSWSPYLADFAKGIIIVLSVVISQMGVIFSNKRRMETKMQRRLQRGEAAAATKE